MFRSKDTEATVIAARTRVRRARRSAGRAIVAITPSHREFGKSTPADTSGDAQPTIQSGGTTLKVIAAAAAHGRSAFRRVQQIAQGSASTSEDTSHTANAPAPIDGQYSRARAARGNDAAA